MVLLQEKIPLKYKTLTLREKNKVHIHIQLRKNSLWNVKSQEYERVSVYDMNIHGCSIYQVGPPPSTPSPVVSSLSLLPWFLVAGLLELSFRPLLEGEGPSARASSSSSSSRGWLPAWLVGWEGREGLREDFRHLRYMMRDFQVNHLQRERTDTRSTQHRTQ